jgi:NAD(P)H dehydrogenase (quinone)
VVAVACDVTEASDELWAALDRADATVFGAPTYQGGPSAAFKVFAEATLPIWARQGWREKVEPGFTHSQAMSGDKLNALQHFSLLAAQHGMVWANLDLLPGWCWNGATIDDLSRLGAWLGVMSQSNGDGDLAHNPRESDLQTAAHLGRRVGTVARALTIGYRHLALDGELVAPDGSQPDRRERALGQHSSLTETAIRGSTEREEVARDASSRQ